MPSRRSRREHQGRLPQPGVPAGPRNSPPPSRQSGGTSGNLSIPHWHTQTPVVTTPEVAGPSRSESSIPSIREPTRAAARAEARQQRVVSTYVTKAYSHKLKKQGVPALEVDAHIAKAKDELSEERDRLLNHPAVQEANAEGKVVGAKGLQRVKRSAAQTEAIKGPTGLQTTPLHGTSPRSLSLTPSASAKLAQIGATPQGLVGRTQAIAKEKAHEKGEPSTLEVLSMVSLGIPGIGVGGDLAEAGLLGARGVAEIATKEGATQVPKILAARGAVRAAEAGRGIAEGARGAAAAAKGIPSALREAPEALRAAAKAAPATARAGVKGLPEAANAAAKGTPAALGRGALGTGKNIYKATGGLALAAGTQSAGIHTAPGQAAKAILEGGSKAIFEHPLETGETTLRAAPAAITSPAALLYTAGQIPFEGTGPLEQTAKGQFEGLKQIGEDLLSGDPKRTQKAIQKEGALTFLAAAPALTKSKAYEAIRSDARGAAAAARRTSGKGRIAPKGVEQNLFAATERSAARKRVALMHSRTSNPQRVSEARHTSAILHGPLSAPSLAKAPEGSHVALQTLLEYGIRDPKGVDLVRKDGPKTEPHKEGKVNLDAALKYAEGHPEIFTDKHFQRAIAAGERASKTTPAALHDAGNVARYRGQGDLFGVKPPEDRVPVGARKYTSAMTREGAWKQLDQMEARVTELRARSRGKGPKGRLEPRRKAEIKALEGRVKGLRKELDPFTRPGQKTARGERKFWDKPLEKEYIAEVEGHRGRSPLVEPVWTHHSTFRSRKLGIEGNALPGTAGGAQYVRRGSLSQHDLVDRGLEAFVRGTVQMPRRKAAGAAFGREFVRSEKLPYTLDGKATYIVPDSETWARISGPKTKENPDGGQYDPKTYGRFPLRQWNSAVKDPFTDESDLAKIAADAEAGRIAGHEPSVIVLRESTREFSAAVNPQHGEITKAASKLSRTASRAILATNPAWVIAQIPAEGIPLALAHPELLNPVKTGSILKDIHAYRKEHPEEAAMLEGSAGASPEITAGSLHSPMDLEKEGVFNPQPAMFAEGAKAMTRGPIGRAMRSTVRLEPLGIFDVKRQNAYRTVLLAAEADKRYRSWTSSVQGMFRRTAKISEDFRGKSRGEMWNWLTSTKEGKVELRKLSDYVDNVQGNWTSFTRYERAFAPLTIFYPFLRYSLRWTLHTFPKTHPLTATIAYMLGQANSNALEKLLGAKPASPLAYAYPVVRDAEGKPSVLPGGARISPGQSGPQQALAAESAPQLLGSLNPILGAGLTALGGPGPFGTKPSGPAGWAAVDQLLAMPALLRILGVHSEDIAAKLGIGRTKPESVIAKAYEKLDPDKAARSILFPALPQSAANARMSNELSRALKQASANSKSRQADVAGDDSLTVKDRQSQIAKMKKSSEAASEEIDGVLKKLGLDKEDAAAYERFKASLYGDEESGGIYGGKKEASSIYDTQSSASSIYGAGAENSKALKYKPPSAGGIGLPDISGPLGAILNPLAAIVGGEKAQAAEVPRSGAMTTSTVMATAPSAQTTANALVKQGVTPDKALAASKKLSPEQRQRLIGSGPSITTGVKGKSAQQSRANAALGSKLAGWGLDSQKAAAVARASKKYGVPAPLIAAIGKVESSNGTSTLPGVHSGENEAGAAGPFQMGNGTGAAGNAWQTHAAEIWGNQAANHSVYNYGDAAMAAAHYLKAAGVTKDPSTWNAGALAYNHAQWYADEVVGLATQARSRLWSAAGGTNAGKVPKKVMTRYQAAITAASQLDKAQLPYVWGGGHTAGKVIPGSGVDCSGAVSYVLQKMGVKLPGGVTSGDMGTYLRPGPGAVTVFYNPEHTFMKIGDKYFGTSHANPGGGAGFIPTSYEQGEAMSGKYNVGHVAGLGKKVAVALGIPTTTAGSSSFPGISIGNSGTTASIEPGAAATVKRPGFSEKPVRLTAAKKLKTIEDIFTGNLSQYGIPSGTSGRPTVSALADLGRSLESGRAELASL